MRRVLVTFAALASLAYSGGFGVSLVQTRHFTTGLDLTAGMRGNDQETFAGFHNDLFPSTGYTQLTPEITYKF